MLNNKSRDLHLSSKKITWTSCGTDEQSQQVPWRAQLLTDGLQGGRPADPPIAHIDEKTVCVSVCVIFDERFESTDTALPSPMLLYQVS
jgi:hypothetical protein